MYSAVHATNPHADSYVDVSCFLSLFVLFFFFFLRNVLQLAAGDGVVQVAVAIEAPLDSTGKTYLQKELHDPGVRVHRWCASSLY